MYILIVARGYPSDKYKMNGIFEFDQAKALAQAGHKVVYAAIDARSIRRWRKWGLESFIKDGVHVEAINIPCGRIPEPILNNIQLLGLRKLYRLIEKKYGKPDIIHAHFLNFGYLSIKLLKDKAPIIMTEHFSAMNKRIIEPNLLRKGNNTYPYLDKVITVSRSLANSLENNFGIKAVIIPNIVDTNSFRYKVKKREGSYFRFVSTGSLIEGKRMDLLIDAFQIAFGQNKEVQLYIFGEGTERNKLEKLIENYGLTNQVFLMGLADRKEIAGKMHESDCFVLASRLETFGVAYIEALAAGLPVIATKCGGPEDFVHTKNGLLIEVDDKEQLIAAMEYMYNNVRKYDSENIANETRAKFSPEAIANQLTDVYKNLLSKS